MIHFVIYSSTATKPFSKLELKELLIKANSNNIRMDLTGMLLYKNGEFMQVLEGDETQVKTLYEKIEKDPRHKDVAKLREGKIEKRLFEKWSMGFKDITDLELKTHPAFSQFMNIRLNSRETAENPGICLKMLQVFRDIM